MISRSLRNRFWREAALRWPFAKGRTRVRRAAWNRVGGTQLFRDAEGREWLLDLDEFVDCHMFFGAFEAEEIATLARLVRERACRFFVDVGANVGLYSVSLAREATVERVFAFEPDPRAYARLQANLFLNGAAEKVEAERVALSDEPGEGELHVSDDRRDMDWGKLNRGANSLVPRPERHTRSIRVETERLDDLIAIKGQSVAIKIDVEGGEAAALRGMRRLLRENDCALLVESFPERAAETETELADCGYAPAPGFALEGGNRIYLRRERPAAASSPVERVRG